MRIESDTIRTLVTIRYGPMDRRHSVIHLTFRCLQFDPLHHDGDLRRMRLLVAAVGKSIAHYLLLIYGRLIILINQILNYK